MTDNLSGLLQREPSPLGGSRAIREPPVGRQSEDGGAELGMPGPSSKLTGEGKGRASSDTQVKLSLPRNMEGRDEVLPTISPIWGQRLKHSQGDSAAM